MPHERIGGEVARLYVTREGSNIRIDGYGDRYFILELSHPNHNSIYSLLVAAMINRTDVLLRLETYAESDPPTDIVSYIVVDQP